MNIISILIISIVVGFFGWVFYKINREVNEDMAKQKGDRETDLLESANLRRQVEEIERQEKREKEEKVRQRKEQKEDMARQRERNKQEEKDRKNKLVKKYGLEMGTDIWLGGIWIGMSEEQLLESKPIAVAKSEGSLRTIYKYGENKGPRGGITYDLEVTVKDGVVKSWQEK